MVEAYDDDGWGEQDEEMDDGDGWGEPQEQGENNLDDIQNWGR